MHPLRHQGMRGVEHALHLGLAMALLAFCDIALGVGEIIENPGGIGPLAEEIIVFEEMIVPEGGVRDDQSLHRGGVFLHDIGHARTGVDDDLIGEILQPHAIDVCMLRKALAERPMAIEERHPRRGIGVEHLLGRDDLNSIWKNVEAELLIGNFRDGAVNPFDGPEIPIVPVKEERIGSHRATSSALGARRWNNRRNTG